MIFGFGLVFCCLVGVGLFVCFNYILFSFKFLIIDTFIKANSKLLAGSTHTINTQLQTTISSGHIQIPIFLFQNGDELCSKSSLILGEKILSQQ